MKMSLLRFIFLGIPESISIVTLIFVITKTKMDGKKIIFLGVLLTCITYLIRLASVTFGVHTIIDIGIMILIMTYWQKADLLRSVIAVLISYICLVLFETTSYNVFPSLFHLSADQVLKNELYMTLIGMPQVILIFLIAFILKKFFIKGV